MSDEENSYDSDKENRGEEEKEQVVAEEEEEIDVATLKNPPPVGHYQKVQKEMELQKRTRGFIKMERKPIIEQQQTSTLETLPAWLDSLIDSSWREILEPEFTKPYFNKLLTFIQKTKETAEVYPPENKVFEAFNLTPLPQVKVVILGQDPYHGRGEAEGLSFSVPGDIKIPSSLQNIYKEIESNISDFTPPSHGSLNSWCWQGVLLLNSVLTVTKGTAASHANQGWETFTDLVLKTISKHQKNVVFLLWGQTAKKKRDLIDEQKHHVLTTTHPSGHSADKGFIGCGHFAKVNEILSNRSIDPINWASVCTAAPSPSVIPLYTSSTTTLSKKRSRDEQVPSSSSSTSLTTTDDPDINEPKQEQQQVPDVIIDEEEKWILANVKPLCKSHAEPCSYRQVKKEGPNFSKWFYTCPRGRDEGQLCNSFTWLSDWKQSTENNEPPPTYV